MQFNTTLSGTIYYRETQDSDILARVNRDVKELRGNSTKMVTVVIVTYFEVSTNDFPDHKNTFQLVIAHNNMNSTFVIMNFHRLDTRESPISVLSQKPCYFHVLLDRSIPFSPPKYHDLVRSTNINELGKHIFHINDGQNCDSGRQTNTE